MSEMRITGFMLDPAGMKELINEEWIYTLLEPKAERVQQAAQANGYSVQANQSYTYTTERDRTDRAVVRVGSSDPGVLFYETATGNLIRAMDAGR